MQDKSVSAAVSFLCLRKIEAKVPTQTTLMDWYRSSTGVFGATKGSPSALELDTETARHLRLEHCRR